ncbi:MAG: hypothetical protein ABFE07_28805 [Armatimonadia bacterium]
MKVRSGFVSNSSSASFVILKFNLTKRQLKQIRSAQAYARRVGMEYPEEFATGWQLREDENVLWGTTPMDNFGMAEFLTKIGVDWDYIGWEDSNDNDQRDLWEGKQKKGEFPIIHAD